MKILPRVIAFSYARRLASHCYAVWWILEQIQHEPKINWQACMPWISKRAVSLSRTAHASFKLSRSVFVNMSLGIWSGVILKNQACHGMFFYPSHGCPSIVVNKNVNWLPSCRKEPFGSLLFVAHATRSAASLDVRGGLSWHCCFTQTKRVRRARKGATLGSSHIGGMNRSSNSIRVENPPVLKLPGYIPSSLHQKNSGIGTCFSLNSSLM